MANIKKSFNFRNGVQVDDDNFIVNPNGLVGIGSTVPTESLDVLGNIRVRGSIYADRIESDAIVNTSDTGSVNFKLVNVGITSIKSGIISATSGIVTYYGDARYLQGMPTSQWIDVDSGLGYTSIYAAGNVGIATTYPAYTFQVGGNSSINSFENGVGITSDGSIVVTRDITIGRNLNVSGISTAYSFSGFGTNITGINASNISNGTLDNDRLSNTINKPIGIITANLFYGNLVGIATTARGLSADANIDIVSIISDRSDLGIATASTLNVTNSAGVGTNNPNSDVHIRRTTSNAELQITSDSSTAKIIIGKDVTITNNNTIIQFNDTSGSVHPQSGENCFDIINYAPGNFNSFIRPESTPNLKFNWINDSTNAILMSLTSGGNLGLGKTNPSETFEVVGTSTITSNSFVGGDFKVSGNITGGSLNISGTTILKSTLINASVGIFADSPNYTLQIGNTLNALGTSGTGVGISSSGNIVVSGIITASNFVGIGSDLTLINPSNISSGTISNVNINSSSGIITASKFVGIGSDLTLINPSNISSGTINLVSIYSPTTGIITSYSFSGIGSNITDLNASNITTGNITGSINVSTSGIITATSFNGIGSNITQLNASNITSGGVGGSININTTGIVTAYSFSGIGSNITDLNASNITSGNITGEINVNTSGIITALSFSGNIDPTNIQSGDISSAITFNTSLGIGTTNPKTSFQVSLYGVETGIGTFNASPGIGYTVDAYNIDNILSAEYTIVLGLGTNYQSQKISVITDSTSSFSTEFAVLNNNNRIVDYSITRGTVTDESLTFIQSRLNIIPRAGMSGLTTFRIVRTSIAPWPPQLLE